jgi:predicted transcriptional regulator
MLPGSQEVYLPSSIQFLVTMMLKIGRTGEYTTALYQLIREIILKIFRARYMHKVYIHNSFEAHCAHKKKRKDEVMARMTVEFNEDVSKKLEELAKLENRSKTEILRRALGLYSYLDKEMTGQDDERFLALTDKENRVLAKLKWL